MDAIKYEVTGARQAQLRFDQFPDHARANLEREIRALAPELYGRIQAATPDATGRLRSQERIRVFADKDKITGVFDIAGERGTQDFAKASALEYGAHRTAKVSAHSMSLDHFWSEKISAPISVLVEAYSRTANVPAVRFERDPFEAMQPEIIARLNAAFEAAVVEANA